MPVRVGVAGASGYAGGELLRLLLGHPEMELGPLLAGRAAGTRVDAVHPHLPVLAGRTFAAAESSELAGCDLVFLALPHGRSAALAEKIDPGVTVVDLGADHRLSDPAMWQRYYPGPAAPVWPYGLPELPGGREALAGARRIAGPGCYPTAVLLALAPLVAADLVDPTDLVVTASSGVSGSGRIPTEALLGAEVMGDLTAYKVGRHQHTPEITQQLARLSAEPVRLSFTTVLAPLSRGLLASCTARARPGVTAAELEQAVAAQYATEPFVHLLPAGQWPRTAATVGSNSAQLQLTFDADAGRAVVVCAIDNLGKGAAGQALQCANLALGLPEATGLPVTGVAP